MGEMIPRIMNLPQFQSGNEFRKTDIVRSTGYTLRAVNEVLEKMVQAGLLTYRVRDNREKRYRRKMPSIVSGPWRIRSNAELGIPEKRLGMHFDGT